MVVAVAVYTYPEEFKSLTPAIFLYSPTYYYPIDSNVKNVRLDKIANVQDRFSSFEDWYIKEKKTIK